MPDLETRVGFADVIFQFIWSECMHNACDASASKLSCSVNDRNQMGLMQTGYGRLVLYNGGMMLLN